MMRTKKVFFYDNYLIKNPNWLGCLALRFAMVQNEKMAIMKKMVNTIAKEINGWYIERNGSLDLLPL